jgi:hypothetical protein
MNDITESRREQVRERLILLVMTMTYYPKGYRHLHRKVEAINAHLDSLAWQDRS